MTPNDRLISNLAGKAMLRHTDMSNRTLAEKIADGSITFAGNAKLKIYGTLDCRSGKRMKKQNRVFFKTETEALSFGFRPCGHCLRLVFRAWKNQR